MTRTGHDGDGAPTPVLVYLSGDRRGESVALSGEEIDLDLGGVTPRGEATLPRPPDGDRAMLRRRGTTYALEAAPGASVWVNGDPVRRLVLASGDVLELGRDGLVLRFRLYPPGRAPRPTVAEVFSDCVECAVRSSNSTLGRLGVLLAGLPRDLATRTSWIFRIGLLLVLLALGAGTFALAQRSAMLENRLDEVTRLTGLADLLERARREGEVTPLDLAAQLRRLEAGIDSTGERLREIQGRLGASTRVVAAGAEATIFLQGSYGFRDPATGRPIRLLTTPDGVPVRGPGGEPRLTAEGPGPVLELSYTGTGFVATPEGLILTNRHVARPWEFDEVPRRLARSGLVPVMHRFVGYLPGRGEPFEVAFVDASDEADVAVLRCTGVTARVPFLELSDELPEPGEEVVVLGYPLGVRALMARASPEFLETLRREGGADSWAVARRLAEEGYVRPLATRGIVGQSAGRFVVYDAETTSGGSGGPVLDLEGRVVAITAAILPEFGGSNLGVPAAPAHRLLERIEREERTGPTIGVPDGGPPP